MLLNAINEEVKKNQGSLFLTRQMAGCSLSAAAAEVVELMRSDQMCCRHLAEMFLPCCIR